MGSRREPKVGAGARDLCFESKRSKKRPESKSILAFVASKSALGMK